MNVVFIKRILVRKNYARDNYTSNIICSCGQNKIKNKRQF